MIIKSTTNSLPRLNKQKDRRLTLDKNQKAIQIQTQPLNKINFKVVKQEGRNSLTLSQKKSLSVSIKDGSCKLGQIFQKQQNAKIELNRNRCHSMTPLLCKNNSLTQIQAFDDSQQNRKQKKQSNINQDLINLRPCHRKLLKNILIMHNKKEDNESNLSFISTKKNKLIDNIQTEFNLNLEVRQTKHEVFNNVTESFCQIKQDTFLPSIKVGNQQSYSLIKLVEQKFNAFNLNSPRKSEILSEKNQNYPGIKKNFRSFGMVTELSLNNESYNEFLKFKLTQQDSYLKMQQLFRFIEDLSSQENKQFQKRFDNINKIYQQTNDTQRQKKIDELIKKIDKVQTEFATSFTSYMNQMSKIQGTIDSGCPSQIISINNQLMKIKRQLPKSNLSQNPTKNDFLQNKQNQPNFLNKFILQLNPKLLKIQKILLNFKQKFINDRQTMIQQIKQGKQQLTLKFEAWKSSVDQKNFITQVCINDLIKLPELSMTVFGSKNQSHSCQEMAMMNKIGVDLNQVPQFDYFYQKTQNLVDFAFQQMLNSKCLNCIYFKSKMRFIQKTNLHLQPVVKILNNLSKCNAKTYF